MNRISLLAVLFIITACGGGGGGGGGEAPTPPTPAPGISFSATPTSVLLNNTSTFSWSTTNATSCTASGSSNWTGTRATSGTEDVSIDIAGNTVFTISCSGAGGTRNASVTVEGYRQTDGVVVDGYISGADVFIDENENFIADAQENATTSDNDGKFTIKYANGSLVSIGGTDLDSQTLLDNLLITHKLDGFSDFKAITPVTSVDAFLESVDVNAALGIDSSINISVDDPVALKGDGGIYDYLYEKGNQLTVLAYALQNITNDLNTTTETTQDFFKSIAEEVETEYTETQTKVDIETEAFIAKALDNVINIKSLNIEETAKQNTLKALSGVLPIIEVKSSDDLTTSVIRFGVATLQEDIKAIANGTAAEDKIESYTTDVIKYIAEDQGISSDEITPDITAIDDNSSTDEDTPITIDVLANDSFITTSPISIDASNGENGTVEIAESSPQQITYSPNSDYFGNDFFSYIITQGDKTSSAEVEVDINPINDAPSIDIASTLSIPENQTAITAVSVSDPDEDDLTLTLSGEDANSLNLTSENVLSFKEEPDFETKAAYSINLSLTDGEETVDKDINIVITNVNDIGPVFTSEATFSVAENQTAIDTVTATDADGDSVTFTVSDSELKITSAGVLTFKTVPDYETKSTYTATVTASDETNISTQDITVNVTDVTEADAVDDSSSGIEDDNIRVDVLANDTFNSADVTLIATDSTNMTVEVQNDATSVAEYGHPTIIYSPDANWFGTDTFTYTVSSGGESDQGTVSVTVTSVNDAPTITSEASLSAAENQTDIGTVTATDIENDTLTYSISGSDISIDSSTGVMTFNSAPDYETTTSYSATVTVSDGTDSDEQDITVNITNVVENSSPVFTSSSSFTVAENQTSAATIMVSDADNDSISFSLSGTDADSFAIDSLGALTFNNAPDYETKESYSLIVTASDGVSYVSQTITISISNVNEVPQISALSSTLLPDENQISIVTVSASDPDANTSLIYSVSGTDSSLFSISSSGVLTFKTAPDYETPGDADADNSYQINVVVSDGSLSVTQAITIQVLNVADLISGVAVDGYVAGATVFQDLNNDGDLDSGEPSAATNSLGSFSLNLSSVNINAPVRIYNGFDLASNEIHPSVMDISVSETGSYIVTPISTLVGRLKIEDTSLSAMVPQSMIAGALGISLADSPNDSILGFDPIAYFNGSDATLAAEARPVFAASQLLMTMGGGNYSVHKYITDQVLSSLSSTLTTAAGSSITLSSANDILGLKQDAYDAIFNGYVDTTLANNPPINSIQFRNNKAVMTDYLNGSSSSAVNYSLYGVHDGTTTLVADLVGAKLDYDNLKQILDNDGTGTPMDLNFELANIPAAGSGSTGVTLKLFYGDDTTQGSDEDYLQITLTANWESDGTNFKIKLPANSAITASFYDRGGTILSITPTNQAEDIFTVTKDGPNRPATLSLRLSKLFNAFPTEVTGLSSFLDGAAEFTYLVEFDNFTIYDHLDNTFTKIQGTFEVDANPGITVFADDIYVHENATSKDISFYLSQATSSDVTLDYAIADASTASSSDYTLSSGTVTIPAGSMSATLTIPVTNDTTVEAQEEIRLTLSNVQNAVLGRSTVSAFITDGEEILANSAQKAILADNIFKDSKASINAYIKNKLDTSTVSISGTSYTYSQVLINNSVTTDVYAYLDSIIDDYEVLSETLISTIMTKADAYIDAQLSSFADYTAFATALTQLNSGIKGLNMSQIVGTNINSNGTFPSGQNATTLQTALDGTVDTLVTLAADTVADILGTDTNTNFPNANVIMGTDGDDTITGTSGSDLIASFGGTDTVNALAGNDKILGGAGVDTLNGGDDNDHLYGYAGADTLNGNAGDDLIYGGKDDDTIDGGAGDDDLRGEAGDDTIITGAGSDTVSGGLGDDTITIDGAGDKTIDGGAGTDAVTINYSGLTSLQNFSTRSLDLDYSLTLIDADSNTITLKNILNFSIADAVEGISIAGKSYSFLDYPHAIGLEPNEDNLRCSMHSQYHGSVRGVAADLANNVFVTYDTSLLPFGHGGFNTCSTVINMTNVGSSQGKHPLRADYKDTAMTVYGYSHSDYVQSSNQADNIYTYAGNDQVLGAKGADNIDLGDGDDIAFVTLSDLNEDTLVGGSGVNTLNFSRIVLTPWLTESSYDPGYWDYDIGVTLNLADLLADESKSVSDFSNVVGTSGADMLTGDDSDNVLVGGFGNDTLSGGVGDDILYDDRNTPQSNEAPWRGTTDIYGQHLSAVSDYAAGNDILYGGSGADTLIASDGDDTLDGGAGADTLTGGAGIDTFVIRAGDGGSSITDADTIQDFTDGTDLIGMDGITYNNLTRETSGSDVVIKYNDEILTTISNTTLANIDYYDIVSISTDVQTLTGTSGDDTLIGGYGDDIFTTGAGNDLVLGYAGNDTITIDGAGDKTIDGGAGTDAVTINYSGLTSLQDFSTRSLDLDYSLTLIDADGNTITLKNILNFSIADAAEGISIAGKSYSFLDYPHAIGLEPNEDNLRCSMHSQYHGSVRGVAADLANNVFVTYDTSLLPFGHGGFNTCSTVINMTNVGSSQGKHPLRADYKDTAMTVYGYSHSDYVQSSNQADNIYTYAGNDQVLGAKGADNIDLGDGDDIAFVTLSDLNEDTLVGGSGVNTLNFSRIVLTPWLTESSYDPGYWDYDIGVTLNLADLLADESKSVSDFSNVVGTSGADMLTGDDSDNVLVGGFGNDTLSGGVGDDILYDDRNTPQSNEAPWRGTTDIYGQHLSAVSDYAAGNDILYGGSGADTLIASDGDDTLDGGAGADTLTGGAGIDTFVIRAGDGGSSITDADTIQDFTDGTDLIGMDGITYNNLTRETSGSDVVIKYNDEILTTISNTTLANIDYYDIVSISTDVQTLTGTSGDDTLIGGYGDDIFTTGAGNDLVLGYAGNDTITIDGAGDKTIDGGAGTDAVTINYSGLTSLQDFSTRSLDLDYSLTLIDADGNTITLKNILNFSIADAAEGISIAGKSYSFLDYPHAIGLEPNEDNLRCSMHSQYHGSVRGVAADLANNVFVTYDTSLLPFGHGGFNTCSTVINMTNVGSSQGKHPLRADYKDTAMTVYGYSHSDYVQSSNQADNIYTYAGNDQVLGAKGADNIDLGDGDDIAFVTLSDLNEDTLVGGSGVNTLNFSRIVLTPWLTESSYDPGYWDYDIGVTLNLADLLADESKSVSDFSNVVGTSGADMLTGDDSDNVLVGGFGNDTLSGGVGDDILYDDRNTPQSNEAPWRGTTDIYGQHLSAVSDYAAGNDILYGGSGADTLIASDGDDTLDGGAGADTLTGGAGIDTFVIRAGDGGSSITDADTIQDFTDGTDIIGMSGLEYSQLTIEQGTGDYANHVVVKKTDTGEFLVIIRNISLSSISNADFSAI